MRHKTKQPTTKPKRFTKTLTPAQAAEFRVGMRIAKEKSAKARVENAMRKAAAQPKPIRSIY